MKTKDTEQKNGSFIEGVVIACSMYSKIPMPQIEWSSRGMKYAIGCFPLIGIVIAVLMNVLYFLYDTRSGLQISQAAFCCLGTALPLLVTGGIHMDGFLDTVDARSSYEGKERRLEILKDPHAGAFAIIWSGIYLLLYVAAVSHLDSRSFPSIAGVYVITRALSGWSVITFPKARKDGLASTFASGAQEKTVKWMLAIWMLASVIFWYANSGIRTAAVLSLAAAVTFWWYRRMCMREFGGMTGDLAGYFLQVSELVLIAVLGFCG